MTNRNPRHRWTDEDDASLTKHIQQVRATHPEMLHRDYAVMLMDRMTQEHGKRFYQDSVKRRVAQLLPGIIEAEARAAAKPETGTGTKAAAAGSAAASVALVPADMKRIETSLKSIAESLAYLAASVQIVRPARSKLVAELEDNGKQAVLDLTPKEKGTSQ